jgi:serine/threonine protein kinase
MPSESVAGFLDRAQASRVLAADQIEQLIREPDIPQADMAALCTYLLSRGVLTQFQADAIRDGRGGDLSFAGYPIIDALGPCPGGQAYRALHPSLRTPLVLRKFAADAFQPADSAAAVVERARTFGTLAHTNIAPVLDAGVHQGTAYAVLEQPPDAADLGSLLKEVGGAMPAFLAAEYGWSIASALRAIHERAGWHGEVRPGLLTVSPLTTKSNPDGSVKRRPAPNAVVKLAETGLIPKRSAVVPAALPVAAVGPEEMPMAMAEAVETPPPDVLAYLPPERIDSGSYEPSGDIYGLGASLYLLLAGRPPFAAESSEGLLNKIRSSEPVPLTTLRPDVPADLAAVVMKLLAKKPANRPATASEVCEALAPFCRPGSLPSTLKPVAGANPNAVAVVHQAAIPDATAAEETPAEPQEDAWGVGSFTDAPSSSDGEPRKRRGGLTEADKRKSKYLIALGLCLHMSAVGLLIAYVAGVFDSGPPVVQPQEEGDKKAEPKKTTPKRDKKKDNG